MSLYTNLCLKKAGAPPPGSLLLEKNDLNLVFHLHSPHLLYHAVKQDGDSDGLVDEVRGKDGGPQQDPLALGPGKVTDPRRDAAGVRRAFVVKRHALLF